MNTGKTAFITRAAEGINPKYPHSIGGDALSKSGRPRRIANRNEAAISDVTAGEVYSCFSAQRPARKPRRDDDGPQQVQKE
jgi:hypothetical protein